MSLLSHMCPKCDYYMPLTLYTPSEEGASQEFKRSCRNCGHSQSETPGLVMETVYQAKGTESYQTMLNEYTSKDPRLPHVNNLPCPNETCPTNTVGEEKDVIYIKYDTANLKFMYICTKCKTHWRSR
jgi:DNA-directed RNA polymerase subunit M/transcription elongation factor TFIIS